MRTHRRHAAALIALSAALALTACGSDDTSSVRPVNSASSAGATSTATGGAHAAATTPAASTDASATNDGVGGSSTRPSATATATSSDASTRSALWASVARKGRTTVPGQLAALSMRDYRVAIAALRAVRVTAVALEGDDQPSASDISAILTSSGLPKAPGLRSTGVDSSRGLCIAVTDEASGDVVYAPFLALAETMGAQADGTGDDLAPTLKALRSGRSSDAATCGSAALALPHATVAALSAAG